MKHLLFLSQPPPATPPSSLHLLHYFSFLSHHLSLNFSLKCRLHFSRNVFFSFNIFLKVLYRTFLSPTLSPLFISPFQSLLLSFSQKIWLFMPLLFALSVFIPPSSCLSCFLSYFGSLRLNLSFSFILPTPSFPLNLVLSLWSVFIPTDLPLFLKYSSFV